MSLDYFTPNESSHLTARLSVNAVDDADVNYELYLVNFVINVGGIINISKINISQENISARYRG